MDYIYLSFDLCRSRFLEQFFMQRSLFNSSTERTMVEDVCEQLGTISIGSRRRTRYLQASPRLTFVKKQQNTQLHQNVLHRFVRETSRVCNACNPYSSDFPSRGIDLLQLKTSITTHPKLCFRDELCFLVSPGKHA